MVYLWVLEKHNRMRIFCWKGIPQSGQFGALKLELEWSLKWVKHIRLGTIQPDEFGPFCNPNSISTPFQTPFRSPSGVHFESISSPVRSPFRTPFRSPLRAETGRGSDADKGCGQGGRIEPGIAVCGRAESGPAVCSIKDRPISTRLAGKKENPKTASWGKIVLGVVSRDVRGGATL